MIESAQASGTATEPQKEIFSEEKHVTSVGVSIFLCPSKRKAIQSTRIHITSNCSGHEYERDILKLKLAIIDQPHRVANILVTSALFCPHISKYVKASIATFDCMDGYRNCFSILVLPVGFREDL